MKKPLEWPRPSILSRRHFLKLSSTYPLALSSNASAFAQERPLASGGNRAGGTQSAYRQAAIRKFLNTLTLRYEEVETFLDPKKPNVGKFDPQLGYTFRNNVMKDGVDGARAIYTHANGGERKTTNYAEQPCRINTYGDSFTEEAQVSDGETWQEYLAAHLGEPIRNLGIGGYGVYQAYRRMLGEEATLGAEYLILNLWGMDDHLRSLDTWRWLRIGEEYRNKPRTIHTFHWAYIRLNLEAGETVEHRNAFATPKSLYKRSDPEFVYEHFKDDLVVKLLVAAQDEAAADLEELGALTKALNLKADFSSPKATSATVRAVEYEYALRVGIKIVEKAQAFAREKNKKLMIVLTYDSDTVSRACGGSPRPDQNLVAFLNEKNIRFVDVLAKHREDFHAFNLSSEDYVRRYFIGHYKPQGNHFLAFAIKNTVVSWLDPKPVAYRDGTETIG